MVFVEGWKGGERGAYGADVQLDHSVLNHVVSTLNYNREYRGGFAHTVARTGARFQVRSGER